MNDPEPYGRQVTVYEQVSGRCSWFDLMTFSSTARYSDDPRLCPPGLPVFGEVESPRGDSIQKSIGTSARTLPRL